MSFNGPKASKIRYLRSRTTLSLTRNMFSDRAAVCHDTGSARIRADFGDLPKRAAGRSDCTRETSTDVLKPETGGRFL